MNVVRKQKRAANVSAVRFGNDCPSTRPARCAGFACGRDEVFHCAVRHGWSPDRPTCGEVYCEDEFVGVAVGEFAKASDADGLQLAMTRGPQSGTASIVCRSAWGITSA